MDFSAQGLAAVASDLSNAARVAEQATAVFPTCTEDGTGEGDPSLDPALSLAFFQERWTAHVATIRDDLDAAAALMAGWANVLSKLDDEVQASLK